MKNKKILVICEDYTTGNNAASERAFALVNAIIQNGGNVDVISTKSDLTDKEIDSVKVYAIKPKFHKYKIITLLHELIFDYPDRNIQVARLIYKFFKNNLSHNTYKYLIVTTPPHTLQIAGYWISKEFNIPMICDMRDPWGGSKRINYRTVLHQFISYIYYRKIVLHSSKIIVNTDAAMQLFCNQFKKEEIEKTIVVPNGYSERSFQQAESIISFDKKKETKLRIFYCGGSYSGNVVKILSSLDRKLNDRNIAHQINIFGFDGSNGKNIIFHGRVNPNELPLPMLNSDILFLLMPRNVGKTPAFSLKAYSYARSRRPVIYFGPNNITLDYLKRNTVVKQFSHKSMNEIIDWMILQKKERTVIPLTDEVIKSSWENRFKNLPWL